jgi:hypothetical protein
MLCRPNLLASTVLSTFARQHYRHNKPLFNSSIIGTSSSLFSNMACLVKDGEDKVKGNNTTHDDPCNVPMVDEEMLAKFKTDGYIQFENLIDLEFCAKLNSKLEDVLRGKFDIPGGKPVYRYNHIKKYVGADVHHIVSAINIFSYHSYVIILVS